MHLFIYLFENITFIVFVKENESKEPKKEKFVESHPFIHPLNIYQLLHVRNYIRIWECQKNDRTVQIIPCLSHPSLLWSFAQKLISTHHIPASLAPLPSDQHQPIDDQHEIEETELECVFASPSSCQAMFGKWLHSHSGCSSSSAVALTKFNNMVPPCLSGLEVVTAFTIANL